MSVLYPVPQPRPVVAAKPQIVQMRDADPAAPADTELPSLTMAPMAPPGWDR